MKKDNIPEGVPIEDHTKTSVEKVEIPEPAPESEVGVVTPMPVFQRALESVAAEEPVVEEPVVEEPVVEEPVVEEPVVEEPVVEEPVVEEPVVEEPVIEEYDDEEEEGGGEYVQLNHVRPRPSRQPIKREPMRPTLTPRIREQPNEDLMERAYSMGERMGFLMAQESGCRIHGQISRSLIAHKNPPQYHQNFHHGFIEGGAEFVDNSLREVQQQEQTVESPKSDMKPYNRSRNLGLGIFGAWLASRIKGGNN